MKPYILYMILLSVQICKATNFCRAHLRRWIGQSSDEKHFPEIPIFSWSDLTYSLKNARQLSKTVTLNRLLYIQQT